MKALVPLLFCCPVAIVCGVEKSKSVWYAHRWAAATVVVELSAWHPELKRTEVVRIPVRMEHGAKYHAPGEFVPRPDYASALAELKGRGYILQSDRLFGITTIVVRGSERKRVADAHRSRAWAADFQLQEGDVILFFEQE